MDITTIFIFVQQILAFAYGGQTSALVERKACVAAPQGKRINPDLELRSSRSFLHCCSECKEAHDCQGVAYATGECRLISETAVDTRAVFDAECVTCEYRLSLVEPHQIEDGSDCKELRDSHCEDGVYSIQPATSAAPFPAFCDMGNGGWTVIQRRVDDTVTFYRGWDDYVAGFGDVTGNWWAGLDNIHAMTSCGSAELWVTMESFEGERAEARYSAFHVGDAASGYVLSVSGYSGTAGDSLTTEHHNSKFSTPNNDQDVSDDNCAEKCRGGWWYWACYNSNPNGEYVGQSVDEKGITWYDFKEFNSLKTIEFKIRC